MTGGFWGSNRESPVFFPASPRFNGYAYAAPPDLKAHAEVARKAVTEDNDTREMIRAI